jgi:hypothetical protein
MTTLLGRTHMRLLAAIGDPHKRLGCETRGPCLVVEGASCGHTACFAALRMVLKPGSPANAAIALAQGHVSMWLAGCFVCMYAHAQRAKPAQLQQVLCAFQNGCEKPGEAQGLRCLWTHVGGTAP